MDIHGRKERLKTNLRQIRSRPDTGTHMVNRLYGSHRLSALDEGTDIVGSVNAKQERYAATTADKLGKEKA